MGGNLRLYILLPSCTLFNPTKAARWSSRLPFSLAPIPDLERQHCPHESKNYVGGNASYSLEKKTHRWLDIFQNADLSVQIMLYFPYFPSSIIPISFNSLTSVVIITIDARKLSHISLRVPRTPALPSGMNLIFQICLLNIRIRRINLLPMEPDSVLRSSDPSISAGGMVSYTPGALKFVERLDRPWKVTESLDLNYIFPSKAEANHQSKFFFPELRGREEDKVIILTKWPSLQKATKLKSKWFGCFALVSIMCPKIAEILERREWKLA